MASGLVNMAIDRYINLVDSISGNYRHFCVHFTELFLAEKTQKYTNTYKFIWLKCNAHFENTDVVIVDANTDSAGDSEIELETNSMDRLRIFGFRLSNNRVLEDSSWTRDVELPWKNRKNQIVLWVWNLFSFLTQTHVWTTGRWWTARSRRWSWSSRTCTSSPIWAPKWWLTESPLSSTTSWCCTTPAKSSTVSSCYGRWDLLQE